MMRNYQVTRKNCFILQYAISIYQLTGLLVKLLTFR